MRRRIDRQPAPGDMQSFAHADQIEHLFLCDECTSNPAPSSSIEQASMPDPNPIWMVTRRAFARASSLTAAVMTEFLP